MRLGMDDKEDTNAFTQESFTGEASEILINELESEHVDAKIYLDFSSEEDARKDLRILSNRVRLTATMWRYLRTKARVLAILEKDGGSSSEGVVKNNNPGEEDTHKGYLDGVYTSEMLESIDMVSDVMESLVRRVTAAESEIAVQKEMVVLGEEENGRKRDEIEKMSLKLKDMERFADETNSILKEMQEKIEELVEETMRQREKAVENEEELRRVKREFESLKSYVSSFSNVRETLVSSERQFKTIEELFQRLVAKTTQLESEKVQKEVEVEKLMEENLKLTVLLDKKEAQLLALNEQCKLMALTASNI